MAVVNTLSLLMKEAIFLYTMRLLISPFILFIGCIQFGSACCNVTERTNVCEDVKTSYKSGLTEQKEQLEEMIDTKFVNLDETMKGYIANLVQQFGQLLETKLHEQKEDFNQKLEQQKLEIMEAIQEKFISISSNSYIFFAQLLSILTYLGEFDNWSGWGACSATYCGEGTRNRTRKCRGPFECIGEESETEACTNNRNPTCTSMLSKLYN